MAISLPRGRRGAEDRPEAVQTSPAGLFFHCGKGACLMIPYHRDYGKQEHYGSEKWVSHRRLMTDLSRGFLMHVGREQTARECLADPQIGNSCRHAISTDGRIEAWLLFHLGFEKSIAPLALTGTDLLSGREDPVLDPAASCAVFRR